MAYEPTVSITMGRKVNLGNFESADLHISLNQIPFSATQEDIQAMIDGPAKLAFTTIATALMDKCKKLKAQGEK